MHWKTAVDFITKAVSFLEARQDGKKTVKKSTKIFILDIFLKFFLRVLNVSIPKQTKNLNRQLIRTRANHQLKWTAQQETSRDAKREKY